MTISCRQWKSLGNMLFAKYLCWKHDDSVMLPYFCEKKTTGYARGTEKAMPMRRKIRRGREESNMVISIGMNIDITT